MLSHKILHLQTWENLPHYAPNASILLNPVGDLINF